MNNVMIDINITNGIGTSNQNQVDAGIVYSIYSPPVVIAYIIKFIK